MRQDGNADGRMKGNFLERDYFYDRNMKKDENVAIAGNCLEQLAAIIMKNTYPGKIDYYAMAIEDLSYHVRFEQKKSPRSGRRVGRRRSSDGGSRLFNKARKMPSLRFINARRFKKVH